MRRLKVLHLIDGLAIGGAEMMLYKLVSRMDRDRFAGSIITFMDGGELAPLLRGTGVKLHTLGLARRQVSFSALWKLKRLLAVERPALLMTWCPTANFIGGLVSQWQGFYDVIWNIRRSYPRRNECSYLTTLAIRLCARLSRRMKVIVTNAEAGRRAHEAIGYRPSCWKVIPNGFDCELFAPSTEARLRVREELGIPGSALVVGIVGRYNLVKDHPTFIRAALLLNRCRKDVHFVMVGEGLSDQNPVLASLASGLLSKGVFHMLGPRRDVPAVLGAMDVFTLTSHRGEGFPNVVGEAMSCGVPCVVMQTAGDAPLIVGNTGLVVTPGEPQALADAWERLIKAGPEERQRLGTAARVRIQEHYSLDVVVRQYEELYTSLAG